MGKTIPDRDNKFRKVTFFSNLVWIFIVLFLIQCISSNKVHAITAPFTDTMERGTGNWEFNTPWDIVEDPLDPYNHCWTDSPGTSYDNNQDITLTTHILLAGLSRPVLTFWQMSKLAEADYGYVEVSKDGGNKWATLWKTSGAENKWNWERIDLSNYLETEIILRFRLVTNGSVQADGWYIDDIRIEETSAPSFPYPFEDDLESGTGNWITGPWGEKAIIGHDQTNCLTDSPAGNYPYRSNHPHNNYQIRLIMANTIDLTRAINPQLSFWHKYSFYHCSNEADYGQIFVSDSYGLNGTWKSVGVYNKSPDRVRLSFSE